MRPAERDLLFEATALVHLPSVYRVALALGGGESEAEDLVQETFVRAYRGFGSFRAGTNCRAWLLAILRNLAADRCRVARREPPSVPLEEALGGDLEPSAAVPPPEIENEEAFLELFGDEVTRMLRALPRDWRLALLLADVEGLAYADIAGILACPVGTVRSRIHRARAFLRERLREYARSLGYLRERKP
ncbi:MAG: sigma-70 family RNA polymerase sigma factor [Planctomycetes bacterium]|nr:sigma-70 family RNA polymerase sigma factor [Planctomycetota bacterium]